MRIVTAILALLVAATGVQAEAPIPDKRLVYTRDIDFYGGDLQALFDTTLDACERVCRSDNRCTAFTFNAKSNACFPKTSVSDRQAYEGAISAEVLVTPQASLALAETRAAELYFLSDRDKRIARGQAHNLGRMHQGGQWSPDALLRAVRDRRKDGNLSSAVYWQGAAVSQTDASDMWIEYARLLGAQKDQDRSKTRRLRERAQSAAVNGYLRAANDAQRVTALDVMATALIAVGRGRDAIPALRLASDIQPRDDLVARLDDAIGKFGFRITEHKVEADLAAPKVCAVFNEPLAKNGIDYASYVALPEEGLAVEAGGTRLCVTGMSHGSRHRLTFREGLPAASGEKLIKDIEITAYVRDRLAQARFPGRAYVLPRTDQAALPVTTVNTTELELMLHRVSDRNLLRAMQGGYFERSLDYWQRERFEGDISEAVWSGSAEVRQELNQEITTRLPMAQALQGQDPGIYVLTARIPGTDHYDEPGVTQWFILSDLGITTMKGSDGLHVFVRGLADAEARTGTEVALLSRSNRVLGRAKTDARGYARFDAGLIRGSGGSAPALITAFEDQTEDMAFLSLTDPAFDLSDRGVTGREPAPATDVFLTTDRGAYRTGETIHVTALVRDGRADAIAGMPVTAILSRPDGVEYARVLSADDRAGGHVFALPIGTTAPRGTWRLDIKADPDGSALASQTLLVEDFLPERIDFDMALPDGAISANDLPDLKVEAKYLFGAPAGNLPMEGLVRLTPQDRLAQYPGYRFGKHDARKTSRTNYFVEGARTNADGRAVLAVSFPDMRDEARPMEAQITLRLREGSGRPVERRMTRAIAPAGDVIGIRPLFESEVPEGGKAAFELIGVGQDLEPTAMPVTWRVNRVETRYHWYQLYGEWSWERSTSRTTVAEGRADLSGQPVTVSSDVDWGRYEIVVEREGGEYTASSVDFYAGWYVPADTVTTPDVLELSLDAETYRVGANARLRVVPRYAGKALVSVMSNRLIEMQAVDVAEGENLIDLTVTEDWGSGAYVTVQVVRPMDATAGQNPARALGLAHATIDPGDRLLKVALDVPEQARPRQTLQASLRVEGGRAGETAFATVAAIDVGILNITGFQSPDPAGHYFGQRRLGMEIRDVYGRLIDGLNGEMGRIRSGGDAAAQMQSQSPPPTQELVTFFRGPVAIGPDGTAKLEFDVPQFNGTLRLMAVAWTPRAVGQAEAEVILRDPVVVSASLPRFLAPGDESRMLLEIQHAEGPVGRMGLDIDAPGLTLGARPSGVDLADQGRAEVVIPITAGDVGDRVVRVALTTPDGARLTQELNIGIRANDPEVSATRRFSLAAGKTFDLSADVLSDYRAGTGSAILSAGPLAQFDVPGLLSALDRYPYGCTEQITSQTMPMLYFESVAGALGLSVAARADKRINQAVARILSRQSANGAFGLWSVGSGDLWLDAYVTDFLTRARNAGHDVPPRALRSALDNLRNRVNYAPDFDKGGHDIAYALMVLAREGAAAMGDLRYYADEKPTAFTTPLAAAQLGAALAFYGDQTRSDEMFARAGTMIARAQPKSDTPVWRADFGTGLRDSAAVLALAVEAGSNAVNRDSLVRRISAPNRRLSTQEMSWSLMAAHAMVADPGLGGLLFNGQPVAGPLIRRLGGDLVDPVAVTNAGDQPIDITLTTFGQARGATEKTGYGYAIERAYYDMDGKPVDGARVAQGTRMVAVLTVTPARHGEARLIIDDPLPAGLEIDNPNLLRSGDVRSLDWIKPASARHAEFRSDRFVAAIDWRSGEAFRLAYVVRAINPGSYHHPAASVEDMYRPEFRANTASGRFDVSQ